MKRYLTLLLLVAALSACRPSVTDIDGRVFVRVQQQTPNGDGTSKAELWQPKDKVGKDQPVYIKLLGWSPPKFVQAQ